MTIKQNSSMKILHLLKQRGPLTSKVLAESLDMTSMGARQHLLQLEQQQDVSSYSKAEKRGRPNQYWQLTKTGQRHFPDSHGQLTVTMIDAVTKVFGDEGLEKLIAQREQDSLNAYLVALKDTTTLQQVLDKLVEIRTAEGYMASWHQSEGAYWLIENHCPICAAATECQSFCRSELAMFQTCIGDLGIVSRDEHILEGARRCAYRIEAS